mmetsp:Transcript_21551/g.67604  ORF Transcript_21551/g.67604 Transcript_21551/m.67604 type:complete len:301 (-) Transcript_21551:121-1023(-)
MVAETSSSAPAPSLGWVGVGIMGAGMVSCLLKEGRSVVVWNRDAAKAEAIAAAYPSQCRVAASPAEVVASCEVTYSMLSNLEASEAVFGEVLEAVGPGKSIVDCATLTPERMEAMARAVAAKGGTFLEAPVSGSKVPAETGQLIFLCGGDRPLYERARPDLAVMGKADFHFGPVGAGTKMKLCVNMIMGEQLAALGEGLALARAAGLPCGADDGLLKVLELGVTSSPLLKLKGPKMLADTHAPHFPLKHAQKDLAFSLLLADKLGLGLPIAAATNAAFLKARPEHGDDDFAALFRTQHLP